MKSNGHNLEEILTDTEDEVQQELSIVFTKKGKVYFVTPELTVTRVEETAKLLAHLIINWGHNIAEKFKTLEGSNIVVPSFSVSLPKLF